MAIATPLEIEGVIESAAALARRETEVETKARRPIRVENALCVEVRPGGRVDIQLNFARTDETKEHDLKVGNRNFKVPNIREFDRLRALLRLRTVRPGGLL